MNTMDYESAMNGYLNPSIHNQVETHTNSSYPLPVSFQTIHGSSVHRSDMTSNRPTDNHFQNFRTTNNRSISYILTHEPASHGYLVTKVEPTRTVWVSDADIDKMLAVTRM